MPPLSKESDPDKISQQQAAKEKDLYTLTPEKLRCPKRGVVAWFEQLVALQREGIEHGVRPQLPRGLSRSRAREWRRKIWNPYLRQTKTVEERLLIKKRTKPGKNRHTGPSHFTKRR